MSAEHNNTRWFRSAPTNGSYATDKVDVENGIIHDVVMVQQGPAKGHGVSLEEEFIDALVAYDKKHFSAIGVKARFGHPSASGETMGTQMGVFKNVRKRTVNGMAQAIGDLHLLEAADESPTHPGMRSWALKMAQERPDFLMSSIVFKGAGYYQRKANGHKHPLKEAGMFADERFTNYQEELGDVYIEFGEHYYTDLVEQGAATDNLFSNAVNPHLFVAQAGEFLNQHPELTAFIQSHPEKVIAFLEGIGISLTQPPTKKMAAKPFNLFKWLAGEPNDPEEDQPEGTEEARTALEEAKTAVTALKAGLEAAENRVSELTAELNTAQETVAQLTADNTALQTELETANAEITELKNEPADVHTGANTDPGGKKLSKTPKTDSLLAKYGIE